MLQLKALVLEDPCRSAHAAEQSPLKAMYGCKEVPHRIQSWYQAFRKGEILVMNMLLFITHWKMEFNYGLLTLIAIDLSNLIALEKCVSA